MFRRLLIFVTKLLITLLRKLGRNGSALPGLVIEKLYPEFLNKVLETQQQKIVIITGTNGKTTTTKMLVAAFRASGARVVTNSTGSNMTRGLIAAIIEDMTYFGSLKPTDWFVFEMDEAYTPIFTKNIKPKLLVALNVLRDQLDRYGEIDKTAHLIEKAAINSSIFIYNAIDPLLSKAAKRLSQTGKTIISFGVDESLYKYVSNEESTHGTDILHNKSDYTLGNVSETDLKQTIKVNYGGSVVKLEAPVKGFHNAINATAVYAVLSTLVEGESRLDDAINGIKTMPTPFGRGERLNIKNKNITVALVKNPSGFASNLTTFVKNSKPDVVVFVVNDRIADGRDVSWLWDVDFKNKIAKNTTIYTSGIRGYDMALRLKHDGFKAINIEKVDKVISTVLALKHKNIAVIPTYTALFEVRSVLSKYGKVPRIW